MRHLIDFGDLTRAEWESLYQRCSDIMDHPADFMDACRGRVMASLFYEPSTRTNFSFQTAMLRVGGTVFGFADPKSTSTAKGETLKDTIKMVSGYADVVVMRNPKEGAAKAASLYSDVPVINAGDGGHMHPTQTTADLTTITRLRGKVDGLSVGLCGDLKNGRTVHSLIKALAKFEGIKFSSSPPVSWRCPSTCGPLCGSMACGSPRSPAWRRHPSVGCALHDPHPAGALRRPPGVRALQGRLRPHPAEAGPGEEGTAGHAPPAPGG